MRRREDRRRGRTPRASLEWEDGAARERRLYLAQMSLFVSAVVIALAAIAILGRSLLAADDDRLRGDSHLLTLVSLRDLMRVAEVDFWRQRALGGEVVPVGVMLQIETARDAVPRLSASDPAPTADKRAAAARVGAAIETLRPFSRRPLPPIGSPADLRALAAAAPARAEMRDGVTEWVSLQRESVSAAVNDAQSARSRLIWVLSAVLVAVAMTVLVGGVVLERARRRVVGDVVSQAGETGALIAAVQDGLVAVDSEGRVEEVNERFCEITGLRREHVIGTSAPRPFWPADGVVALLRAEAEALDGSGSESELDLRRADGTHFPAILTLTPLVRAGQTAGYVATVRDQSEQARADAELRRRARENAALERVATTVASFEGVSPEPVFAVVAEEAAQLMDADAGRVVRFSEGTGHVAGAWGASGADDEGGMQKWAELSGESATVRAYRTNGPARGSVFGSGDDGLTEIAAPVRVAEASWGVVSVAAPSGRAFPRQAEDELARFADLVALSVSNADARAQLAAQAAIDPLTGLANHRVFHERLAAEVGRAARYGRAMSVAILDVDNFKVLNDRFGHERGDRVIAALGRRLAEAVESGDLAARIGGEEFAVILPETAGVAAWQRVDHIRRRVCAEPFDGDEVLTLSAGVCDLEQAGNAEELFRLADGALYWAKAHGRDAAFLYSPNVVTDLSAAERAERLERAQALAGLRGLARAVDAKDPSTRMHSERVADLADAVAQALGWGVESRRRLREAGLLHDVGKIGIPDSVLFKPGRLTDAEYDLVKQHAALGADIVKDLLSAEQAHWIRHHHERIDGRGYPDGLVGDESPEGARILAVADAWDVMTSARPYSGALDIDGAVAEVRRSAGSHLDSRAAEALLRVVADGYESNVRPVVGAPPAPRPAPPL